MIISNEPVELHWFWKMLGFSLWYTLIILDEPELVGDGYVYNIKLYSEVYYWLGFKLKTIIL